MGFKITIDETGVKIELPKGNLEAKTVEDLLRRVEAFDPSKVGAKWFGKFKGMAADIGEAVSDLARDVAEELRDKKSGGGGADAPAPGPSPAPEGAPSPEPIMGDMHPPDVDTNKRPKDDQVSGSPHGNDTP